MAIQSSQLFPITRLRDLPVFRGTVGDSDTILVILGNGQEQRVPLTVFSNSFVDHATAENYGIVKLTYSIKANDTGIPNSGQVFEFVTKQIAAIDIPEVKHATQTEYGTVILSQNITAYDTGVVTAQQVYNYVQNYLNEGGGNTTEPTIPVIEYATQEKEGVVKLAKAITREDNKTAVTPNLVYSYVADQIANIPIPTPSSGTGNTGSSVTVVQKLDKNGKYGTNDVPSASAVLSYVDAAAQEAINNAVQEKLQEIVNEAIQEKLQEAVQKGVQDALKDYSGDITIKNEDGTTALSYDKESSTLYIGKGVCRIVMQPDYAVEVRKPSGEAESSIIVGEPCSGKPNTPSPTPPPDPEDPEPTPTPTPIPEPSEPEPTPIPTPVPGDPNNWLWGFNNTQGTPYVEVRDDDTIIDGDLYILGNALIKGDLHAGVTVHNWPSDFVPGPTPLPAPVPTPVPTPIPTPVPESPDASTDIFWGYKDLDVTTEITRQPGDTVIDGNLFIVGNTLVKGIMHQNVKVN